jgi:argininosuccinate lyase
MLKDKSKLVRDYLASITFDKRLYTHDIAGSIAHVKMLAKQEIISKDDAELIVAGLNSIQKEIQQDKLTFSTEYEDIHMNIEARLYSEIGDVAGKLHTGRSRNDQIALDIRLFLRKQILDTINDLRALQQSLVEISEENISIIMPGYTHLQHAQPVLLAHHLLAYFEMFQRDKERFYDCLKRTDVMPLGSGALAGVSYKIDRNFIAQELGFKSISANSMDAVSDRDFVIEYHAAAAITIMHLSRFAEELILWSSEEFGFIQINESFTSGSSIMPQKKNPDVAELVRSKTGRIYGNLIAILTSTKALPLAYNRDLQEDKEGIFDTVDTLHSSLNVFTAMIKSMSINTKRICHSMKTDYFLATDIADYLVKKGTTFRQAHSIVSQLSNYAINHNKQFRELNMEEYHSFSQLFNSDVYEINLESSISARDNTGGTSPKQVKAAIDRCWSILRNEVEQKTC